MHDEEDKDDRPRVVLEYDVYSDTRRDLIYGYSGDIVIVLSDHAGVLIVEDSTGKRFPYKPNEKQPEERPIVTEKPKVKPTKRSKTVENNNLSMFDCL